MAAPPSLPPSLPAPAAIVIQGVVSCSRCPAGPIDVQAFPATDRYRWPWWNAYGFLQAFHAPEALDALRPAPLASLRLERPGRFRLSLPAGSEAHLFARLDVGHRGPNRGPAAGDWIGRFPRNPLPAGIDQPVEIELYPLSWSPDYRQVRYQEPAPTGDPPAGTPRFADTTAEAGLDFRHCQGGDPGHLFTTVGSGALLEDLDGDGDLDLVAVQGRGDCPGAPASTRLFLNDGKGRFRDATEGSGLGLVAAGMGVVAADYDRDGDFDLYLTTYSGAHLFRNDGQARFADVTAEAGVADDGRWAVGASFGDVDGDGWPDLYVANYVTFSPNPPFVPDTEIPTFVAPMLSSPFAFPAQPNRLYRNLGNGRFAESPAALGADDPGGKGMAAVLADLDLDGDLDLYVTNDCTPDRMYEHASGRFLDRSREAGVDDISSGMGIALGDVDGDLKPDLFSPHWLNEPSAFYLNRSQPGRLVFADWLGRAGLAATGSGRTGWAAIFLDADLDGDLDLLVSNGHTHPGTEPGTLEPQPLQLFVNDGQGRFSDRTRHSGTALADPRVWRGATAGDIDGDGDIDLYAVAWNGRGKLLRNLGPARRWAAFRLVRTSGEAGAPGARVRIRAGGRDQVREVVTGTSYLSHLPLEARFGLGGARRLTLVEVTWPGGRRERFPPPPPGRVVTLREGAGQPIPAGRPVD